MRDFLRYFFAALLLLVIALVSALTAMRFAIHGREVTVPDLRGKSPAEARRLADANGLAAKVESNYYSQTVAEGKVLSQVPVEGTVVRRGWEVVLALSLGPQRVTIPQLVGESERAAEINVRERGLQISSTARIKISNAPDGQVLAQDPPANAKDVLAPKVSLLVAQKASLQSFVMLSLVGQPLGSVTISLRDAGFSVGKITLAPPPASNPAVENITHLAPSAPVPANQPDQSQSVASPASIVVSQDPAPGERVVAGSAINLVVR